MDQKEDMGERAVADRVRAAVDQVLSEGNHVTRDLGGTADTAGFTDAVIAAIEEAR